MNFSAAREFAKDGQKPWTPPVSICFALDVAIERYHTEGAPRVYARMGTMGDLTAADMLRAFAAFDATIRAHGFACSPETGVNAARAVLDEHLVVAH